MGSGKKALFGTGDTVPETGIYRVTHALHRLPHEIVILRDEHFPRCSNLICFFVLNPASMHPTQDEGRRVTDDRSTKDYGCVP
jgi:hypothetical protein